MSCSTNPVCYGDNHGESLEAGTKTCVEEEEDKEFVVVEAYTVAYPRTVMVHSHYTSPTYRAMMRSRRLQIGAFRTKTKISRCFSISLSRPITPIWHGGGKRLIRYQLILTFSLTSLSHHGLMPGQHFIQYFLSFQFEFWISISRISEGNTIVRPHEHEDDRVVDNEKKECNRVPSCP